MIAGFLRRSRLAQFSTSRFLSASSSSREEVLKVKKDAHQPEVVVNLHQRHQQQQQKVSSSSPTYHPNSHAHTQVHPPYQPYYVQQQQPGSAFINPKQFQFIPATMGIMPPMYQHQPHFAAHKKRFKKAGMRKVSTEVQQGKTEEKHEIKAFTTAAEYNFDAMFSFFQKHYIVSSQYYDDIMHIILRDPKSKSQSSGEVYFHKNGSFVSWNVGEEDVEKLMLEIKEFEVNPYEAFESETLDYVYRKE
jgi:hypothetical protein